MRWIAGLQNLGLRMTTDAIFLDRFYRDRYEPRALRRCRPNTRRLYRTTLRMFARYLERPATLEDLNDCSVSSFALCRKEQGRSPSTVNKDLNNLLAIWRWAHKRHFVESWPDVDLETETKRTPRALSRDELRRLFRSAKEERRPVGQVPGGLWWPTLLLTCWDTGERIGGVMGLTWDACDLERRWLTFRAENRKGAREDNTVRIAGETAESIASMPRVAKKVFAWPYCETYIWKRFEPILERAQLPTSREFKFHCLRKSMASHLEAAGGNATQALRHSKRSVTEAYLDPRIVERTAPVDMLFRPMD